MKKKKIILLSEPSRMLMKKSKEKRIYIYYNIYHHISVKEVYVCLFAKHTRIFVKNSRKLCIYSRKFRAESILRFSFIEILFTENKLN